ncbi:tyrosine phosphatase [Salpingoeca rosetta]|uniref:protein-tyrosine-phosphatase n=1 Tax=Salpingoeca rosetta (strain ATCC 50818 / BSB-021) TaxID=946362 RepID=F2TVJ2_SALR5|nr:tyrosine phosphatase [Salpingoeca rosetta]EGD72088.1 tyrosine phosphatase [Salpingoeca rosetta]|eukprot:XP_004998660.1 tyrosine phosphatase [Salpingoeca rosetta]
MTSAGQARMHISPITHKGLRFVITDRPTEDTLPAYIEMLKQHNVKHLVRVCEPSYPTKDIEQEGIRVHDWPCEDGAPPPKDVRQNWLKLCNETFAANDKDAIAVHCVAGLGRAPVLVAISLIESGMSPEDAVIFIRKHRHGAINKRQLLFLQEYKRSGRGGCTIL